MKPKVKLLLLLTVAPAILMVLLSALVAWSSMQHYCKLEEGNSCVPLGTAFAGMYESWQYLVVAVTRMWGLLFLAVGVVATIAFVIRWLKHYIEKKRLPEAQTPEYVFLTILAFVATWIIIMPKCINMFYQPFLPGIAQNIEKQFQPFVKAMEEYRDIHGRYPLQQHRYANRPKQSEYRPANSYPAISLPFHTPYSCLNHRWKDKSWAYHEYMHGGGYCLEVPLPQMPDYTRIPRYLNGYVLSICYGMAKPERRNGFLMMEDGSRAIFRIECY